MSDIKKKKPVKIADQIRQLKKLGIDLPAPNSKSEKAKIYRQYAKYGQLARSFEKNPQNYKRMHVGDKTLKMLSHENFDRFHVIGKTAKKTTVLVRKPPFEEPRLIKGRLHFVNNKMGISRLVVPVAGKDIVKEIEKQFGKLKVGEFLQIQVGDKTPIFRTLFNLDEFNNYFKDTPDEEGNDISPFNRRSKGWKNPKTKPSDYLSIVKSSKVSRNAGDQKTQPKKGKK